MRYRNHEGYADPTAGAAIALIAYEERKKRHVQKKIGCAATDSARISNTNEHSHQKHPSIIGAEKQRKEV